MVYIFHDSKIEIIDGQEYKFNKFLELLIAIRDVFNINYSEKIIVHNIAFYLDEKNFFKTSTNEFGLLVCDYGYLIDFLSDECRWRGLTTGLFECKEMFFGLFDYDYPFVQHKDQLKLDKLICKFELPQKLDILNYPFGNSKNELVKITLT